MLYGISEGLNYESTDPEVREFKICECVQDLGGVSHLSVPPVLRMKTCVKVTG
jgi:hypothetical protein